MKTVIFSHSDEDVLQKYINDWMDKQGKTLKVHQMNTVISTRGALTVVILYSHVL